MEAICNILYKSLKLSGRCYWLVADNQNLVADDFASATR